MQGVAAHQTGGLVVGKGGGSLGIAAGAVTDRAGDNDAEIVVEHGQSGVAEAGCAGLANFLSLEKVTRLTTRTSSPASVEMEAPTRRADAWRRRRASGLRLLPGQGRGARALVMVGCAAPRAKARR